MVLAFTDNTSSGWTVKDQDGYFLNDDQQQNTTHLRTVDLSSLAGKTINNVAVNDESDTAAGAWNIYYDYVSLVAANGSVYPIYTGQTSSPITSISGTSGETGLGSQIDTNRGKATDVTDVTTYYTADHLGSSRMVLSGNGYPVWSGVFLPYGQEWNPQITMNHYKFTGDERDSESNLDHTQFRQYEGTQGRWLSPDPYLGSMDLTNPQSLNRYAYVTNSPTNSVDPLGLVNPRERCRIDPDVCLGASNYAGTLASDPGGAFGSNISEFTIIASDGEIIDGSDSEGRLPNDQLSLWGFDNLREILPTGGLRLSNSGDKLIRACEGQRTHMYNDPAGNCTSGIGNLVHLGECSQSELGTDTSAQDEATYRANTAHAASTVNTYVDASLNQQEFDAIVDFTFNTGALPGSGVLKALNKWNFSAVPNQLNRWIYAGGNVLPGLVNRRSAEGRLFSTGQYPSQCK